MAGEEPAKQYVVFCPARLLGRPVEKLMVISEIDRPLWALLNATQEGLKRDDYTIESLPEVDFQPAEINDATPPFTPQVVFSVSSPSVKSAETFRRAVRKSIGDANSPLKAIGINPALMAGEYSVPAAPDSTVFGTIDDARHLINADRLPPQLDGNSVNVVLIDAGIDRSMFPPGVYGGGWHPRATDPSLPTPPLPGQTTGANALHGMMIVNNILAIAPQARIFDVPLIPLPKVYNIFNFLHVAEAVYHRILRDVVWFRANGPFRGPWVFMNAWAIFDRRSEGIRLGEYTENLGIGGVPHPFIQRIEQVGRERFDIVFCAGNCGEVCPDGRCGPNDYGPGRSIWGANAHMDVLTTGAVRIDETWSGYSSEGPGPTPNLDAQKPDLCAPSQFVGRAGRYPPNSGTSTSAAIAAGVVCALRSRPRWNQTTVPPYILKLILNNTARQTQGLGWNRWLGHGILDVFAAYQRLLANFP
jgi:hypothetical protein